MNKQDLLTLFQYNQWSTQKILNAAAHVTEAQFLAPADFPHGGLRSTLVHTVFAEWIWRARWEGTSPTQRLKPEDFPTLESLRARFEEEESKLIAFVERVTDEQLNDRLAYKSTDGKPHERILWHLLVHLINHSTQHKTEAAAVLIETPANPTLTMTDLRHAAACVAQAAPRPLLLVDNTLLGPIFQHPFDCGADVVLYSATKYLSGFSDLIGGLALTREAELSNRMRTLRGLFGTILQPDECWLLDSRLPTVGLRMRQATDNAREIVSALARHSRIARIDYPTLFADPDQRRIRDTQCEAPGAMFSIELKDGKEGAFAFLRRLRLARNAVSLGGVETLVCHPRTTTHSGFTAEEFRAAGITDGLVRFSIGVEDWRDLLADFEQALASEENA